MNQSFVLDSLNDFYTQWSSAQCLRLVMLRGHSGSIFNEIVKVLKKEKKGLKLLFLKHHKQLLCKQEHHRLMADYFGAT